MGARRGGSPAVQETQSGSKHCGLRAESTEVYDGDVCDASVEAAFRQADRDSDAHCDNLMWCIKHIEHLKQGWLPINSHSKTALIDRLTNHGRLVYRLIGEEHHAVTRIWEKHATAIDEKLEREEEAAMVVELATSEILGPVLFSLE